MDCYFLDSSALVKRYLAEPGSTWIRGITAHASGNDIWITNITPVEVASTMHRKRRMGVLASPVVAQLPAWFQVDVRTLTNSLDITPVMVEAAIDLVGRHNLRSLDAIQLAVALALHGRRTKTGLPPLTFLSSDHNLLSATAAEGIPTDDPAAHP
jgi:hypothetical protein